jgi:DeoR family suf operon transcriptional repressor
MGASISEHLREQPLPLAHKGPRGLILVALKRAGYLTARELGDQLGLSSNAIRHHLKELEAQGAISYRREQRGVGAPTFAWYLSASGDSLFPQRYKELLTEVLERVAEQTGRQAVVTALETRFTDLAVKLRDELAGASPEKRMDIILRALVNGGYMAEWHEEEGGLRLVEHNCAIRALAERFPEICEAEHRFLEEVLGAALQREGHMLEGCSACEYQVQFIDALVPSLTTLRDEALPSRGEHP